MLNNIICEMEGNVYFMFLLIVVFFTSIKHKFVDALKIYIFEI